MISKVCLVLLALLLVPVSAFAQDKRSFPIIYILRENDPAYVEKRSYAGIEVKERRPPIAGVKTSLKEAKILGRAMKLDFPLVEHVVEEGQDALAAIETLAAENRDAAFVLDLPHDDTLALARGLRERTDLILFNVRQEDDALRGADCSAAMFHTLASMSMRTDSIAQFLYAMNWRNVLVLGSAEPADVAMTASFVHSAEKFGLTIAATREFVTSNDPREREKNNPKLITGGVDYDVIFIADDRGEFSRMLAYSTYLPRPLLGAQGLVASSWFYAFERNGAPQVNQRIHKFADAHPLNEDWAAWAAVRSVVQSVVKAESTDIAKVRAEMLSPGFSFDASKVGPASFRPWDHQLRQAMMLHTDNAVIATAPLDGFLHSFNTYDTLGRDEPETACHLKG